MNWPTPPSGSSKEASFMRRLVACCKASVPKAGIGLRHAEDADGITLSIIPRTSPASSSVSSTMTMQITQVGLGDYFMARAWDGNKQSGAAIAVAKAIDFRTSFQAETIDGIEVTHGYADENTCTSTDPTGNQTEKCWPRFVVGAEIRASLCSNGTPVKDANGKIIQWADLTYRDWLAIS